MPDRLGADGIIGTEILRRYKVIWDYPHSRVVLEPNNRVSEPYEYNMSGLSLVADGIDFNTDPAHSCSPVVISSKPEYRFMLREVNPALKTDCNLYFKKCGTLESRELLPKEETS